MNTEDKLAFIDDLTTAVAKDIKAKITSGAIPDHWDGHELRVLLSEKFSREAERAVDRNGVMRPRSPRLKAYRHAVAVENI